MIRPILAIVILFLVVGTVSAKSYTIATLHDYYPYSKISEDGKASGIIVDWWLEWSKVMGISIEFVPMDANVITQQLKNGEVDIIAGFYYSEERATYLKFGDPIIRMQTVLFVKQDMPFDSIAYAAVLKYSMASDHLKQNYPTLNIYEAVSLSLLREEVAFQQIDAFVYDIPNPIGNYKGMDAPDGYYKYTTLFTDKIRPAVLNTNAEVLNDIMIGANEIPKEKLVEIARRYEMYEQVNNTWKIIIIFTFALLIVIIFLLLNIRKQKHQGKRISEFEKNTDWQVILDKGENDLIEFKSSLRWDYRQEKPNKALEMVIVKTLSAFLNTQGGMLFIGVDDSGKSLGLEPDYNSFSKKNRDGFLLTLTNLINQNLGTRIHQYLTFNIISINDKDVCIVNMEKSDTPVFIGKGDKEEFYIRTSAASQPLGIRESYEYIRSNWS